MRGRHEARAGQCRQSVLLEGERSARERESAYHVLPNHARFREKKGVFACKPPGSGEESMRIKRGFLLAPFQFRQEIFCFSCSFSFSSSSSSCCCCCSSSHHHHPPSPAALLMTPPLLRLRHCMLLQHRLITLLHQHQHGLLAQPPPPPPQGHACTALPSTSHPFSIVGVHDGAVYAMPSLAPFPCQGQSKAEGVKRYAQHPAPPASSRH